jgi:hypothetical protein
MIDDETIRKLLIRLSRQDRSGGRVIERAAILAEGADSESIFAWILAHDGQPEALGPDTVRGGLHGTRLNGRGVMNASPPRRSVLPPDVLS